MAHAPEETREYTLVVGENVRRYTEYRVMLTADQAEVLSEREQHEVDTDPDVMDLLGDVAVGGKASIDPDVHNPETTIISIELEG